MLQIFKASFVHHHHHWMCSKQRTCSYTVEEMLAHFIIISANIYFVCFYCLFTHFISRSRVTWRWREKAFVIHSPKYSNHKNKGNLWYNLSMNIQHFKFILNLCRISRSKTKWIRRRSFSCENIHKHWKFQTSTTYKI